MEGTPLEEESRELEMRALFEERAEMMGAADRLEITLILKSSAGTGPLFGSPVRGPNDPDVLNLRTG